MAESEKNNSRKKYDYKFEGKKTAGWEKERKDGREDHLHYDTAYENYTKELIKFQ